MSVFYPTAELLENKINALYFDHRAAIEQTWAEYRAAGAVFFKVVNCNPLRLDVWFKSKGQKLIDQFSHISIDCLNVLDEIVDTGNVKTMSGVFNLKDSEALDLYTAQNPNNLMLPKFDYGKDCVFLFAEPPEDVPLQMSFLDEFFGESETTEPPKFRVIKSIALIDVKTPEIKDFDGKYTLQIENDTDVVIYNDNIRFSRGNYAPFVVGERLVLPPNAYVFRENQFNEFLTERNTHDSNIF